MAAKYDPDYARGVRGPGSIPGRGAWLNILDIRKAALMLEKKLTAILMDSDEKEHCLRQLDATVLLAEGIILRYDRNGPPENDSELFRAEAALRWILDHPAEYKGVDVEGHRKLIALLRKKIG
jgi:hypothetical protein